MSGHTPGPWIWEYTDLKDEDGFRCCTMLAPVLFAKKWAENCVALAVKDEDARLIAAAPDLLKACKHARNAIDEDLRNLTPSELLEFQSAKDMMAALDILKKAIAKAEGE